MVCFNSLFFFIFLEKFYFLYFSKALFQGLIFGGGYIRRGLSMEGNQRVKIDWASLMVERKFNVFALFYFVFEGKVWGGVIHGGAYFRNFTVYTLLKSLLNYLQIT